MKGKKKCEFLKGIRKRMAEANGIPYEPQECNHEEDCSGTCPYCEHEAAMILSELKRKKEEDIFMTDTESVIIYEEVIRMCDKEPMGRVVSSEDREKLRMQQEEDLRRIIEMENSLMGDVEERYWIKKKEKVLRRQQEEEV